jgi:hypothetical protein
MREMLSDDESLGSRQRVFGVIFILFVVSRMMRDVLVENKKRSSKIKGGRPDCIRQHTSDQYT